MLVDSHTTEPTVWDSDIQIDTRFPNIELIDMAIAQSHSFVKSSTKSFRWTSASCGVCVCGGGGGGEQFYYRGEF